MPRDANTNYNRFVLLFAVAFFSVMVGVHIERHEFWSAAFAGMIVVSASAILGEFLYVREK